MSLHSASTTDLGSTRNDSGTIRHPLRGSMANFARPAGTDLLGRTNAFWDWQQTRRGAGVWSYSRTLLSGPGTEARIADEAGVQAAGINFASQDYLSLSAHPSIRTAVAEALAEFGPHSAGSPCLVGNTRLSMQLEQELGELLELEHIALFPTGWGAGFGVVTGLVRPDDHALIDHLSHACLRQGAYAATRNVAVYRHLSVDHLREKLIEIRSRDAHNAILVVTEGLFSMDSDVPEIAALQEACKQYAASLVVDVAHDLGAMGPGGAGQLGIQQMLGGVDLVMGSFSKTFASNGGFVASASPAVRQYLKWYGGPHTFSNALSPLQTAAVLAALRVVRSSEGERVRDRLASNVQALREGMTARGMTCMGIPSAIVPVLVGSEALARVCSRTLQDTGLLANLVEYPGVPVGSARFRFQVQAGHSAEQIESACDMMADAVARARSAGHEASAA